MNTYDDLEAQALAYDEQCEHCGAESGQPCVNILTGHPMRATHWQRVRAGTRRVDSVVADPSHSLPVVS